MRKEIIKYKSTVKTFLYHKLTQRTVTAGCLVIKFTENRDKVLAREEDLRTIKQLQINTSFKNKLSQQSLNILVKLPHWLRKKNAIL